MKTFSFLNSNTALLARATRCHATNGVLPCLVLALASACGGAGEDPSSEDVGATEDPLLLGVRFVAPAWAHGEVKICFNPSPRVQPPNTLPVPDQAAFAAAKERAKTTLRNHWEKAGRIHFTFDQDCGTGPTATLGLVALPGWENGGRAPSFGAVSGSGEIGYCVASLPNSNCTTAWCNPANTDCVSAKQAVHTQSHSVPAWRDFDWALLHEVGHSLGFFHEHQRTDTPASVSTWCASARPENRVGDSAFIAQQSLPSGFTNYQGAYDKDSVVNYCRDLDDNQKPDWSWQMNIGKLSAGDKAGAAALYGPPYIGSSDANKRFDYFKCSEERANCNVGSITKYVAFGAEGSYVFKNLSGAFACTISTFGSDPKPGVNKSCHVANFTRDVGEGGAGHATTSARDVAYGANGRFVFKRVSANTAYTCNVATFGSDPVPGVVKSCYLPLLEYTGVSSLSNLNNTPVAYGANGKYRFKVLSGSPSCSSTTFGGDPAPNVSKLCFKFNGSYLADEWQDYSTSTSNRVYFGSGLNGAFTVGTQTSGSCSNGVFGDPDPGQLKRCYAVPTP